jgi:Kef-type K+ transport system membrane component KefB
MIMENKRGIGIVLTVVFLLLIPLIAMQFTNEVNWNQSDFVVAGVLLLGTGLICELVMRKVKKTNHRIILCAVILAALLLIWIELAVGLFGTPFAGS